MAEQHSVEKTLPQIIAEQNSAEKTPPEKESKCTNCDRPDSLDNLVQCGHCECLWHMCCAGVTDSIENRTLFTCRNCLPEQTTSHTVASSIREASLALQLKRLEEERAIEKRELQAEKKFFDQIKQWIATNANHLSKLPVSPIANSTFHAIEQSHKDEQIPRNDPQRENSKGAPDEALSKDLHSFNMNQLLQSIGVIPKRTEKQPERAVKSAVVLKTDVPTSKSTAGKTSSA